MEELYVANLSKKSNAAKEKRLMCESQLTCHSWC
jgi:hypothetical protein